MTRGGDVLRRAWEALKRGDYAERDRLLQQAERAMEQEAEARVLEVDFYVNARGVAFRTRDLYAATH